MNLDRDLYLVISYLNEPIILEVTMDQMKRDVVMQDIRDGQYREVLAVLQINPIEKICRECTDEFRTAIDDHREAATDARRCRR